MRQGLLALVIVALVAAACGESNGKDTSDRARGAGRATPGTPASNVEMRLIVFRPEILTVPAGSAVTWTQSDAGFHTVTSGTVTQEAAGVSMMPDGRFDSGKLAKGQTFTHTFSGAGTFPYFCTVHPATMRGEIRVT